MTNIIDSPECVNSGDTTWVLVASILVLSMMPSLAFFEAGLLKTTNSVAIIAQIVGGASILCIMWQLFGYTMVFAPTLGGVIGNFDHLFMMDVSYYTCSKHAPNIPAALYGFFEMMFAAISPLLITGAYIERMQFKAFALFTMLWEIFIYYPVAHWIWGDGWLHTIFGVLDFAGGIVIHTTSGVSALVCALVLGQRKGFDIYDGEFPPSNLPLAAVGAALLWIAWFGFNAGSAMSSGGLAVSTVVATQRSAVCSCLVWLLISWVRGKPSAVGVLNGVIAGLAGITPASGYINPQYGAIIGIILGFGSYCSILLLKHKLRIDDALDVSSVHGVTGIIGSISIGFFAQKAYNSRGADGLFYGNNSGRQLGVQVLAVLIAALWSALITFLLLKIIDRVVGLKIQHRNELNQDREDHGETAYSWLDTNIPDQSQEELLQPIVADPTNGIPLKRRSPQPSSYAPLGDQ